MKTFYIGTYTNEKSEGIYQFQYDNIDSTNMKLAASCESPSYLCLSHDQNVLYAVKEDIIKNKGAIMAYAVEDDQLRLLNTVDAPGQGLVHIVVNRANTFLFTVNYLDATILMYRINSDYSVGDLTCVKKHSGCSSHPTRQKEAHAHSVCLTPDEKYLCVCDLGTDQMVVYEVDQENKTLVDKSAWTVTFPSGSGPRHMVFHPSGDYAYVFTELFVEVYVLTYHKKDGFKIIQKEYSLPEELRDKKTIDNTGAAIRITREGKYLYTSVRGEDVITVFDVQENGHIERRCSVACEGKHPRDFIMSKDETLLLCANRDSNDITIFDREQLSGELSFKTAIGNISHPVAMIEYSK